MQAIALCGRQSCLQAAFQAAVQQTTHTVRTYFSEFVFAGIPQRSLRNSSRIGNGGLKGRLQARLPAARMAKVQKPAESRLQPGLAAPRESQRDEFLGLRRFNAGGQEAGGRSNCARLDKLKHVLHSGADMSAGAADTSVRAKSGATACRCK
jgi:hypothetical protein